MNERAKQSGLSVFITVLGIGLLLFCRHEALSSGAYSLKLLFLGAVLVVWGPMSLLLNMRDPMTTRRAISRLTTKSAKATQSITMTVAVIVLGVVLAAVVDYLFGIWIDRDLAACKVSNSCGETSGAQRSVS